MLGSVLYIHSVLRTIHKVPMLMFFHAIPLWITRIQGIRIEHLFDSIQPCYARLLLIPFILHIQLLHPFIHLHLTHTFHMFNQLQNFSLNSIAKRSLSSALRLNSSIITPSVPVTPHILRIESSFLLRRACVFSIF